MTTLPSPETDSQLRRRAREEDSLSCPVLSLSTLRRKSVLAGWRLKSRNRRGIRSPRSGALAGWLEGSQPESGGHLLEREEPPCMRPDADPPFCSTFRIARFLVFCRYMTGRKECFA